MEIQEQYMEQDLDDQQVNHIQSITNKTQKSDQSSTSSVSIFLDSIGKKSTLSSSNAKPTNRNKLNNEMSTYRSLAQREYNSIVDGEKTPDVVSVI
jgi:lipoprotein NlpI